MPEKTSPAPAPAPAPPPTPAPAPTPQKPTVKKKGGWFQKVPRDILFSPGGVILILLAGIIEVIDWIPVPLLDQILEIPLEIIFLIFFIIIVKPDIKSLIIPFVLERIPVLSDILPTWLLKMFI